MLKDYFNLLNLADIIGSSLSLKIAQSVITNKMKEIFGADSVIFFMRDFESFSLQKENTTFINLPSQYIDQYIDHYNNVDPFIKPTPGVYAYRDIDVIPRREIRNLEFYKDFMKPQGVRHCLFLHLYYDDNFIGQICAARLRKDSHSFSQEDVFKAQLLAKLISLFLKCRIPQKKCANCYKRPITTSRNSLSMFEKWQLTARENQIAYCILQGQTNNEICGYLNISLNTVTTHVRHIFEKAEVTSRTKLIHKLTAE